MYGYTCCFGYILGYIFRIHFFFHQQLVLAVHLAQLFRHIVYHSLLLLHLAVAYLSHTAIVAFALSLLGLQLQVFQVRLRFIYLIYNVFFFQPLCFQRIPLYSKQRYVLAQLFQLHIVLLSFYGLTLYLQLAYLTFQLIQRFGHRVQLQFQLGCALIYKVNGLIR